MSKDSGIGAIAYVEGYLDGAKMALEVMNTLPLMKARAAIKEMVKTAVARAKELKEES